MSYDPTREFYDDYDAAFDVRPHLLDIHLAPNGKGSFAATVRHINTAGPRVKVELITQWGDPVRVELDDERLRELALRPDTQVYLSPRENRVFVYQI